MQFIKRYFYWMPVILLSVYGVYVYAAPCNRPIPYKMGTFDSRFGITEEDFQKKITDAADVWSKAAGKSLFVYDPQAHLAVNLVYDERQALSEVNTRLHSEVNDTQDSARDIQSEYRALEISYKNDEAAYDAARTRFEKEQATYNASVDYWNDRGGAPTAEYNKLVKEKQALSASSESLEKMRVALNNKASQINTLINTYNNLVSEVNKDVHTINQTAGREFDEGEYVSDRAGKRINIYEFASNVQLERVLAHEFGHALGLDHNDNADSIMYYLNASKNTSLTAEDTASLRKLCGLGKGKNSGSSI